MNGSCSAYPSCLYTIQATRFSFKKITGNIFRSTAFQLSKYAPCIFDPANNQLHKKNKEIPFNHHQSIQSISCTRVSIILSKSCYNLQKKIYKSKFFKGNSSWNYFQRYATFISERTIRGRIRIVIIFIASLFVHEGLFLADNEIHSSMRRSTSAPVFEGVERSFRRLVVAQVPGRKNRESLVPTNLMEHRTRDVIRPRTHPLYSRLFWHACGERKRLGNV